MRLWINNLLFHLMDLNWVQFTLAANLLLTLNGNEPLELFIHHPLAHSPVTEHLLCTYYAPNTVQRH